jgi:hypothetical protein
VVFTVRVANAALGPVKLSALAALNVTVGVSCAPAGPDVIAALNATIPTKPPVGVTVIVDVFEVVAPGAIAMADPEIVKPGGLFPKV